MYICMCMCIHCKIWKVYGNLTRLLIKTYDLLFLSLFPTWEPGASWPAWRSSRRTRRKAVNCVCVCICMSCCAPMMFTCIEVLRLCNSCKGESWACDIWAVGTNNMLMGQRDPRMRGCQSRLRWTYSGGAAEDSRSSMYGCDTVHLWYCFWDCWMRKMWRIWMGARLTYFFCRLKINLDSHEFILEIGTIANNTYHAKSINEARTKGKRLSSQIVEK
jgi:hypothetical protein